MTLNDLRAHWEEGQTVVFEHPSATGLVAVLKSSSHSGYNVHRYFQFGNMWDVSVDHSALSADVVLEKLGPAIELIS